MAERKVALFLVDETNEFQRLLRADGERAAERASLALDTHFSGMNFAAQLSQLQDALEGARKPGAVLVMCVNDRGLQRLARRAAQSGVHVVFLNASADDLDEVRKESPGVALTTVCPDERETGRIQGRQFRSLVPAGGHVLYVQGRLRSLAARDRTAGMQEAIEGAGLDVVTIEAGWTAEEGREAAATWMRIALRVNRPLHLIGCQNDMLATGVLEALEIVAHELGRPEIAQIPVTGCDGSPLLGQSLVRKGALRATVVLPRATTRAIELVDGVLRGGALPPGRVLLEPVSFPTATELAVTARAPRSLREGAA